jgi:CheY-like chemotaxis protein
MRQTWWAALRCLVEMLDDPQGTILRERGHMVRSGLGETKTILVVDDERDVREALELSLSLEGYQVVTARHGREALDLLERGLRPSLVLLDLMMPVMNGRDFLAALRGQPEFDQLPVVVVTAFGRMAAEFSALGLQTQGFVPKPASLAVLLDAVRSGLGHAGTAYEGEIRPL